MRLEIKPRRRRRKKIIKKWVLLIPVIPLFFILLFLSFGKMSTMLREVAQSELDSIAYDIIGEVAEREIMKNSYDDIVKIERDDSGRITSITGDTKKLNLLKLRISNELSQIMLKRTDDVVSVPLGSLTGIDFLTGRGPKINVRVCWVSGVDSEVLTSFTEAGINQTNYRVLINFKVQVGMMFAGREIGTFVDTDICIAETVIVGEIPKFLSEK